jgi:hypothetical protein
MHSQRDLTANFSVSKFELLAGTMTYNEELCAYCIIVPLANFILDEKEIETNLWFDNIKLMKSLDTYIGETIDFPINPNNGYIDGSIYLRDAHNPVDISSIKFIKIKNENITVALTMNFVFEYEGIGFTNESLTTEVKLTLK